MKRIALFLLTNFAVMLVLSISARLLGVDRFLAANGLNMGALLGFSLLMGFGGSIVSLLMSKTMAKMSTGAQIINDSPDPAHRWIVSTVARFAERAGIQMPEVAIYEGEPNAFATGAFKNSALVAVSTGLLNGMTRDEVEAVIGHEIAHVANGDMVTLTLIQGVTNTFVIFLSRAVGFVVDRALQGNRDEEYRGPGIGYMITSMVLEVVLGILATMVVAWFSRYREYRADAGSAQLMGDRTPMMRALARLGGIDSNDLPQSVQAMGITGKGSGLMALFASHPPIEARIEALRNAQ